MPRRLLFGLCLAVSSLALVSTTLFARWTGGFLNGGEFLCVAPPYVGLLLLGVLVGKNPRAALVMSCLTVLFTGLAFFFLNALREVKDRPDPGNAFVVMFVLLALWGGAGFTAVCTIVIYEVTRRRQERRASEVRREE